LEWLGCSRQIFPGPGHRARVRVTSKVNTSSLLITGVRNWFLFHSRSPEPVPDHRGVGGGGGAPAPGPPGCVVAADAADAFGHRRRRRQRGERGWGGARPAPAPVGVVAADAADAAGHPSRRRRRIIKRITNQDIKGYNKGVLEGISTHPLSIVSIRS
jgi:hypothetical protein